MALPVERAGPVCWAVEPSPDRIGFRKRLLLGQDALPPATLYTALAEDAVDRWIERNVAEEDERAEFEARQANLFDTPPTPAEVGEEGAAKALAAASSAWRESAWRWILARNVGTRLTSDDLTEAVGIPPGHPHAVGGIIKNAATAGYLAKSGHYVESHRESCRGAALAVWIRTERT